jgi:hypothetical protein
MCVVNDSKFIEHLKTERERRTEGEEKSVKLYIQDCEDGRNICFSPVLKVLRQCPLVFLVKLCWKESETLGSK